MLCLRCRGQESAGIVTSYGGLDSTRDMFVCKGNGLVSQVGYYYNAMGYFVHKTSSKAKANQHNMAHGLFLNKWKAFSGASDQFLPIVIPLVLASPHSEPF